MAKGPNSFFVVPDSEMIIDGTIYSSSDATGLYPTTCVADTSNSGSMSAFVIGNPTAITLAGLTTQSTFKLRIQESGSNYSGNFIQMSSAASGSDDTLKWHGEPDRRFLWDIHNPLLTITAPKSATPWNSSLNKENVNNIKGVYYSVLDKEFLYVSRFENAMPRLYAANRDIKNHESSWVDQGEITTLDDVDSTIFNVSQIDPTTGDKEGRRGLSEAYYPSFDICEHSDGKLKLAVKYNDEIDVYESTDGTTFTLVAKNILSRFTGKRAYKDLKIASSGPYLKIVYVTRNRVVKTHGGSGYDATGATSQFNRNIFVDKGEAIIHYNALGGLVSSDGGATWTHSDIPSEDYTTIGIHPEDDTIGVPTIHNGYSKHDLIYDLCGLSDGSGTFVLVTGWYAESIGDTEVPFIRIKKPKQDQTPPHEDDTDLDWLPDLYDPDSPLGGYDTVKDIYTNSGNSSSGSGNGFWDWLPSDWSLEFGKKDVFDDVFNFNGEYPTNKGYIITYVSSANGRFKVKKQLTVPNYNLGGKPFICTNNDSIWLLVGGAYQPVNCGWNRVRRGSEWWIGQGSNNNTVNLPCDGYYAANILNNTNKIGYRVLDVTRENAMFVLRIDADLNSDKWVPLGENEIEPNGTDQALGNNNEPLLPEGHYLRAKSGRSTGALGSYFFRPSAGNFYSCGPYVALASLGKGVYGGTLGATGIGANTSENTENWEIDDVPDAYFPQYFRFSGWLIRPPAINLGHDNIINNNLKMVEKFVQQPQGVLSVPEFNYIWGKPVTTGGVGGNKIARTTQWAFRQTGQVWSFLLGDGLFITEDTKASAFSYQSYFYYFRCPSVTKASYWSYGLGQTYQNMASSDIRYPSFPWTTSVTNELAGESSWIQRVKEDYADQEKPPGCCIQFVFGGVTNGSTNRNSIGIKINSFTNDTARPPGIAKDAFLYEFFLRMGTSDIKLMNTSKAGVGGVSTTYYREDNNVELCAITLSAVLWGASNFSNSWWEGKISFLPPTYNMANKIAVVVSVRKLGTETWQDSSVYTEYANQIGEGYDKGTDTFKQLGIQGISFGLFPDSSSQRGRDVGFRSLKVCQGSDMTHLQMVDLLCTVPNINLIRGRQLAPNPIYLGSAQQVSWGGIGAKFADIFDTKLKSSYEAKNTIKTSSPRFEYRSKGGNTSDIKSSSAEIIYQIPNDDRTASSLPGYALFHSGIAFLNTNAGQIKIEYSDTSNFSSPYVIGTKNLSLVNGRISAASNNVVTISINGETVGRNSNNTQYTSTDAGTYYCKFTALSGGGLPASLANKSYKIVKSRGNKFFLNLPDRDFSDGSYSGIAGTSISIYSDRMVARYTTPPTQNKYMRITLSDHLGTTDYFKLGSMVAGITFGMQRVPINWKHEIDIEGNVTEFKSRSGVRWGYKEGPSVRKFTGDIEGDVFDEERRNIENIAKQATQFNNYPVAWVFDGDTGQSFDVLGDDARAKAHINPENILYGTINDSLKMVNEGWRYDESTSEWKVVGDLQLTITEIV